MRYAPPAQYGIHLTIEDDHFLLAITVGNPTEEELHLRTMTGALFNPTIEEKGGDFLWQDPHGTTMAVARHSLDAGEYLTRHYHVDNRQMAEERAEELDEIMRDIGVDETRSVEERVDQLPYLDPDNVNDIIQVSTSVPSGGNYHPRLTRQYDLRYHAKQHLDDEVPPEGRHEP